MCRALPSFFTLNISTFFIFKGGRHKPPPPKYAPGAVAGGKLQSEIWGQAEAEALAALKERSQLK